MKNPHYTDPLAAAWMAKTYGMRFNYYEHDDVNLENSEEIYEDMDELDNFVNQLDHHRKIYIHPDCLHLLEPIPNDLFVKQGALMRADEDSYQGQPYTIYQMVDAHHRYSPDSWSEEKIIIQRDGKPFFWPESEE